MAVEFNYGSVTYPLNMQVFEHLFEAVLPTHKKAVYLFNQRRNRFEFNASTVREKLHVILNSTPSRTEGIAEVSELKYKDVHIVFENPVESLPKMTREMGGVIHIVDDNGFQLAHVDETNGALYIPFDVFGNRSFSEEQVHDIFKMIFDAAQDQHFAILALRTSWSKTPNREELTKSFKATLRNRTERQLEDARMSLQRAESAIQEYSRSIKRSYDDSIRFRNTIEAVSQNANTAEKKLFADLDAIVANEKFEDVTIVNGKINLHTVPLYAYTKENKRYYMGKYSVEVNMDNSEIKFTGDNARRSYWTSRDPHPHVSGRGGNGCLGNVASTIAELCSQYELYALALVIVDYLENVNIEDIAGRHVRNWDEVDENGKVIVKGFVDRHVSEMDGRRNDTFECEHCGDEHDNEESTTVFLGFYDGDGRTGEEWCDSCREDSATYITELDIYVHASVADDVEAYLNEQEEE